MKNLIAVDLNTETHGGVTIRSAYLRYSNEAVARTLPIASDDSPVAADLDANGNYVGLEIADVSAETLDDLLTFAYANGLDVKGFLEKLLAAA